MCAAYGARGIARNGESRPKKRAPLTSLEVTAWRLRRLINSGDGRHSARRVLLGLRTFQSKSNVSVQIERGTSMNIFRRLTVALLPLAIPLLAAGGQPSSAGPSSQSAGQSRNDSSPLVDKVRAAT